MTPKQSKSKITITAKHMAYGVVAFTLEATNAQSAFERWKQVVFSPRQWVVTHNSGAWAEAEPAREAKQELMLPDESDLGQVDDI
jgi:hypothetical protein